jgi:hypothetical protein
MIFNGNTDTHDIYLPAKRAPRTVRPLYQPPNVEAKPNGSHEQRQAWMRQRQQAGQTRKRREFPRAFHVTGVVNAPAPKAAVYRHPNSIIVKFAEQLRASKGVL